MRTSQNTALVAALLSAVSPALAGRRTPTPVAPRAMEDRPVHTYLPRQVAGVDPNDPQNFVPATSISMSYGQDSTAGSQTGAVDMVLEMGTPAVVLEHIASVSSAECVDGFMNIIFADDDSYNLALDAWVVNFVMVTSGIASCDAEGERSFYNINVKDSFRNIPERLIELKASKSEIGKVTHNIEMDFLEVDSPTKRSDEINIDTSKDLTFTRGIDPNTVLFEGSGAKVVADKAEFSAVFTFTGKLKYNIKNKDLETLSLDISTRVAADVGLTATLGASFTKTFEIEPKNAVYSFVNIPGIIVLGPSATFGLAVELDASAEVKATMTAGLLIPAGKATIDIKGLGATIDDLSWNPEINADADVSGSVEVGLKATPSVGVELTFEVLGGLLDLSTGLRAKPGFETRFTFDKDLELLRPDALRTRQDEAAATPAADACDLTFKSAFVFSLEGYATQFFEDELFRSEVPLADVCYNL